MSASRKLRRWPAAAILVIAALALIWIRLDGGRSGQERFTLTAAAVVLACLALLLWFLLFSRARARHRLIVLVTAVLLGVAASQTLRIDEVTGDLVPIVSWRWSGSSGAEPGVPSPSSSASAARPAALPSPPKGSADYPRFLGPHGDATVRGIRLARDWHARPPREVWRQPIGAAWSAFAVARGVAVTQEQRGEDELVTAYELATGRRLWEFAYPARFESTIAGDGPRANPTVADGRVYAMGSTGLLTVVELATGELVWQRDVLADNEARNSEWGKSCSPLVLDDLVVVSAGGTAGRSLVAYGRDTGEPVWSGGSDRAAYASPKLVELAGRPQIVILNKSSVAAHAPDTGEVLWDFPWPSENPNVAQPLALPDDRLLVSSGYGVGSKMLRIRDDGAGGLGVELLWESPRLKAKFTNVVLHEGYVYGLDDGVLVCLDPETGERCWKSGRYGHGQVILAGDLLLVQSERGELVLVEPDPAEHRELARLPVLDGKSWNNPALAGRFLLVRNHREAALFELPLASS